MNPGSKEYFEKIAGDWDRMQQSFFSDAAREKAIAAARVKAGDTVADIGAGTGYMTAVLADTGAKIIAVDQSPKMLGIMKQKFAHINRIEYRSGNAENLPLGDDELDHAFANMYLHHVEDPGRAIKELARALKPGGRLIITDLDKHDNIELITEQYDRWMGFERDDIRRWFEKAGLTSVSVDCVDDSCCCCGDGCGNEFSVSIFIAYGEKTR